MLGPHWFLWMSLIYLVSISGLHRLLKDWSWPLTQPSHQTLGRILAVVSALAFFLFSFFRLNEINWKSLIIFKKRNGFAACCFSTWVILVTGSGLSMIATNLCCCHVTPVCHTRLWRLAVRLHFFSTDLCNLAARKTFLVPPLFILGKTQSLSDFSIFTKQDNYEWISC